MTALISQGQLDAELDGVGEANLKLIHAACGTDPYNEESLALAVASRETWATNIQGDSGHGKGFMQIDNRSHLEQLAIRPGVVSGTWGPIIRGTTAAEYGYCPTLEDGLAMALPILEANYHEALAAGVPASEALAVAVAGYNCGSGNAIAGARRGDPDRYTTGQNYSSDVLGRQPMVAAYLKAHQPPPPDPLLVLTTYEHSLVVRYKTANLHPHLHARELDRLRPQISVTRKAVYRAAVDGIAGNKRVQKGWHIQHRLERYHILAALVPPQANS